MESSWRERMGPEYLPHYYLLEHLRPAEEAAILEALERAEEGIMNYYVGWNETQGMKVFDGRAWLNRYPETEGFWFLWGVWSDGTLILNPE